MTCPRCAGDHTLIACDLVKAVQFRPDNTIERVEFLTPADFPQPKVGAPGAEPEADYPRRGESNVSQDRNGQGS